MNQSDYNFIKETFIANIHDTYTLNLAMDLLQRLDKGIKFVKEHDVIENGVLVPERSKADLLQILEGDAA